VLPLKRTKNAAQNIFKNLSLNINYKYISYALCIGDISNVKKIQSALGYFETIILLNRIFSHAIKRFEYNQPLPKWDHLLKDIYKANHSQFFFRDSE